MDALKKPSQATSHTLKLSFFQYLLIDHFVLATRRHNRLKCFLEEHFHFYEIQMFLVYIHRIIDEILREDTKIFKNKNAHSQIISPHVAVEKQFVTLSYLYTDLDFLFKTELNANCKSLKLCKYVQI